MTSLLDNLDADGASLAPTFAFLDPFGFKGMPMIIVARILRHKVCESLITFMEGFVNRFSESEFHETVLDEVFGTPDLRKVRDYAKLEDRRRFLLDLYIITPSLLRRVRSRCFAGDERWFSSYRFTISTASWIDHARCRTPPEGLAIFGIQTASIPTGSSLSRLRISDQEELRLGR